MSVIDLNFLDLDRILLAQNARIIHQIWFGTIPNKRKASKVYKTLKIYRDSWKIKNPTWFHIEWNVSYCNDLVKIYYPEHYNLYCKYSYDIQRCDAVRYFILHRYGGVYADMDYYCNQPFDYALQKYCKCDVYLVETPNDVFSDSVSNSLMYSPRAGGVFWRKLMMEMEIVKVYPYYSRHVTIMFTTGPGVLKKSYWKYKYRYRVDKLPYKRFHPFGIGDDVMSLNGHSKFIYAIHLGKGSWESVDSKFLLFFVTEWRLLVFFGIVMMLLVFRV